MGLGVIGAPGPEGPSTQYSRTLGPKTIPLMAFGTKVLKYWVLGPSGIYASLYVISKTEERYQAVGLHWGSIMGDVRGNGDRIFVKAPITSREC